MNLFFIFLFLITLKYSTSIKLIIKEADANNQYFIERDRLLSLSCESDSISQKEMIQWFLPSSPYLAVSNSDSTQKVSIKDEYIGNRRTVVLSIRDVSSDSSGKYSCRSYQYEGSSQKLLTETFVYVTLFKPITIINCEPEQYILMNSTGYLRCELDSDPKAFVNWIFNGQQLTQTVKYKILPTGLTINDVTAADRGHYVVQARQIDYKSGLIRDIVVKTIEPPRITVGPRILRPVSNGVPEAWYSDIQCLAEGNPPPTVNWFRKKNGDEELQVVNPQRFFVNTNPKVGTLRISQPVYPDDNDDYICKAMLPHFMTVNIPSFTFDSRTIPITISVYPTLTQVDRMHVLIDAGKTAIILCRIRTSDPVTLVWQKFNYETYVYGVQPTDSRITVSVSKEPFDPLYQTLKLEIANVRYSDSWNYSCIATSPGFNVSYNGTISVRQRPILSNLTSKVEYGWLFNATNLTCSSHGLPHPRWFWYRYRYSVLNDINSTFRIISWDYETHSTSWLQIIPDLSSEYWIYDHYECQAQNDVGEDRRSVQFARASIPGPPKVLFLNRTSSSLRFRLSPPNSDGGMRIMHYEMVYRALSGATSMYGPVFFRPDETEILMDGLVHDTNYQIGFFACNEVGRSQDTIMSDRTDSATVPYPVRVIQRQQSTYPYGYNVQWEIPLDGGYPLLGYRIILQALRTSPNYQGNSTPSYLIQSPTNLSPNGLYKVYEPLLINPYISMFRLDDLEACTVYKVSVEVRNQIGYSVPGYLYFYTPDGDRLGRPARVRGGHHRLVVLRASLIIASALVCRIVRLVTL